MKDKMRTGWFLLVLLCCSTCKKEDYREKYVGVYNTTKLSRYSSGNYAESYVCFGKVEISISNDAPDMLIATFDDSLDYKTPNVAKLLYDITPENKLYLQINEEGLVDAYVYNYINPEIRIDLKIDKGELNATFVNRVVLSVRITHLLKGKRAL
ncbi:MAG: hypothetical protein IPK03_11680 [Bacteroidetes bacterium]|nr:hypothetical protein [Bacteroidota bacterium]